MSGNFDLMWLCESWDFIIMGFLIYCLLGLIIWESLLFIYLFFGLKEELQRTNLELDSYKEKIKENQEKIKLNKQLPYLVGNIVEVLY